MSVEMDAVDDIPPELKDKIAHALSEEFRRQNSGGGVIDFFTVFRAGLAVCRDALQEKGWQPPPARIGEATQRAMAGPELPHNEAGVPVVPETRAE